MSQNYTNSWLVYLSHDLDRTFKLARSEINLLVDSVRCAFNTTKRIIKKMLEQQDHLGSSEENLLQELGFKDEEE